MPRLVWLPAPPAYAAVSDVYPGHGSGVRSSRRPPGSSRDSNIPPLKMVDVYSATIPTLTFAPGVHVNYGETVLP